MGTSRNQAFRRVATAIGSSIVRAAAGLGGGTDVIVRIISSGEEDASGNIESFDVPTGSITIVPDAGVDFELKLMGNSLILKRGNKLQGFKITSGDPSGSAAAIKLNAGGTPLKDMVINCTGITTSRAGRVGGGDKCVHVTSSVSGTVTLENVRITIPSSQSFVTGILHEGSGTLKVTNSSVVAVSSGQKQGVVGIYGNTAVGSVEVVGSTVSLSGIQASGGNVFAVLLSPIGSGRVEGSSIQVKEGNPPAIAIGVCVNATDTVTVQRNRFTNVTNDPQSSTSIAIYKQAGDLVPTPITDNNTFNGFSTSSPDRRYVDSGFSCP
ncbi:hypothetical protein NW868_09425 [Synechococcus sp. R60.2]